MGRYGYGMTWDGSAFIGGAVEGDRTLKDRMLDCLTIKNVCLAPELKLKWAPRFNIITGDNGLGKSFLLDTAWWALTRTCAESRGALREVWHALAYRRDRRASFASESDGFWPPRGSGPGISPRRMTGNAFILS